MNNDNRIRFLQWSIIFHTLLIINQINAQTKNSLTDINDEKRVFDGDYVKSLFVGFFCHNKNFAIDDCIPLAFGDFNADKIVDIFCRNTKGDTIRVMLNDDRSPKSKEQYKVNITYD
jgi:hypothetical protein